MTRWSALGLAAIPLLLGLLRPPIEPGLVWWTTGSLAKVRPFDREPENHQQPVKIRAARNEFEPFQVILRADGADIDGVDVEVSDLKSSNDSIPSDCCITIYAERYIALSIPSSVAGGTGEWPDALIPRIDRFTKERRNAFPFKLTAGRNQPIWIDVYVPASKKPGAYHGTVAISSDGKSRVTIPVDLEVWNFQLPSTSSLPTAFGFSGISALKAHYGKYTNDHDLFRFTSLYQRAALANRVTLDVSASIFPSFEVNGDSVNVKWDRFDAEMSPFLDGSAFAADQPLPGAKTTSFALHNPQALKTADQQIDYWRQTAEHLRRKGWFDRFFHYLWDEPKDNDFPAMIRLGQTVRRADPAIKNLVTAPLHPEWSDFIDIWTPVINCFEPKPHEEPYCMPMVSRSAYDPELAKGKQLWWYQACSSHGCFIVGGDYFRGWPSYMIDDVPVRNRIMEWMTWKYGVHGELYFSTVEAFTGKPDPWKDVRLFGGNGDGTLFYPGKPSVIGGKSDIPIESIRLKLIREGLEDYEYLTMLTKTKGYDAVAKIVNAFIRNTYDYSQDPQKLEASREAIGLHLNQPTTP